MKIGCIYIDFDYIKEKDNLPDDSVLKHIEVNNKTGEIEIYFYTNKDYIAAEEIKNSKNLCKRHRLLQ